MPGNVASASKKQDCADSDAADKQPLRADELESYAVVSKDAEDMFEATGRNVHTELQKKQFHKPLRVLACGDIHGRLDILESALNEMSSTGRTVDFVLAVGCFLPQFEIAAFKDYVGPSATRKLPVPVYFIDYLSDVFIEKAAKDGKGFNLPVLEGAPPLTFVGACGIQDLHGLRVAFLSGRYSEDTSKTMWGVGTYDGPCYTANATSDILHQADIQRGSHIDVLLTSEWPDVFWSTASKSEAPTKIDEKYSSPVVRNLFFQLKPRYHIHSIAGMYRYRKAEQGPHGFVCTSIGLGTATEFIDAESSNRWFHLLTLKVSGMTEANIEVEAREGVETQTSEKCHKNSFAMHTVQLHWKKQPCASAKPLPGRDDSALVHLYEQNKQDPNSEDKKMNLLTSKYRRISKAAPKKPQERCQIKSAAPNDKAHSSVKEGLVIQSKRGASFSGEPSNVQGREQNKSPLQAHRGLKLRPGWQLAYSKSYNRSYYHNPDTGVSEWLPPVDHEEI